MSRTTRLLWRSAQSSEAKMGSSGSISWMANIPPVSPDHPLSSRETRTAGIRRRMILILVFEFALLMGVAAIEGFWPGRGPGMGAALGFLAACSVVVPIAMAALARGMLRDVDRLEEERARLFELYGQARLDAMIDGLTGLGNHRAFQD